MATQKPVRRKRAGPTFVAAGDAPAKRHNERDPAPARNALPPGQAAKLLGLAQAGSQAAARLVVEELLLQRCGNVPLDRWKQLGPIAEPALLRLLDDSTAKIDLRQRAIVELGELKSTQALGVISRVLLDRDEHPITRAYAATALGVLGNAAGIGALVQAAQQPDAVVRRQAARALSHIGSPQALRGLLLLATDADAEVARVAHAGIASLAETLGARVSQAARRGEKPARRARTRAKVTPKRDK